MIDFSSNPAFVNKIIPKGSIFDADTLKHYSLSDITWQMSIKPGIRNVKSYVNGRTVMEEINVFSVTIKKMPDSGLYLNVIAQIYSKILYPCVVFFTYKDKYKITAWKFIDSVKKQNHNILKSPYISSWIRDPATSIATQKCVQTIENILLYGEGSINELYAQICHSILTIEPMYIGSKNRMLKILNYIVGKPYVAESILKTIEPTKMYTPLKRNSRYQKKQYASTYKYAYEYEDIWVALQQNEITKRFITKGKFRDTSDLVEHIQTALDEQGVI